MARFLPKACRDSARIDAPRPSPLAAPAATVGADGWGCGLGSGLGWGGAAISCYPRVGTEIGLEGELGVGEGEGEGAAVRAAPAAST